MNGKDWVCPICLDSTDKDCHILEPCKHKFHTKCLIESLRKCNSKCPYCRGLDPAKESPNQTEISFEENGIANTVISVNSFNTGWNDSINDNNLEILESDIQILNQLLSDDVLDIDCSLDNPENN